MSGVKYNDKGLFAIIGGVLVLAIGALVWGAFTLKQRRHDLAELALQSVQQLVQVRLDGFFHELAEDIREEGAALDHPDSLLLHERWFPLLDTHWPILSIHLADEFGSEFSVMRQDSVYQVTRTVNGSKDGPPISMAFSTDQDHTAVKGPWLSAEDHDPREQLWFNKALEDTRNEPIWTLGTGSSGEPLLYLSYLIRGSAPEVPYQILAFNVDISRSAWFDSRRTDEFQPVMILADDQSRSLLGARDTSKDATAALAEAALAQWSAKKTIGQFSLKAGSKELLTMIGSYPLHGQQLNMGVVVDPADMGSWIAPERNALIVAAILLLALTILLIVAWLRKRSSDERIRKQAKRNRSQELKLAKALGEREVLNREVHHRVKNNLQVVSSLLNLQATRLEDGPVKNEFLRGKRRIDTIALVHHKLYGLADLRNVDLSTFFGDLVKALAELHAPNSRAVSHEVDTNGIKADQDTAIELGIILCELVGNTYQHAFPYVTGGHVEIKVRVVEGDLHRLIVKDNGKGLPEHGHQGAGKLGLEIVEALSEQLDGSFHMLTNAGVQFEVLFRMQRDPSAVLTEQASDTLER